MRITELSETSRDSHRPEKLRVRKAQHMAGGPERALRSRERVTGKDSDHGGAKGKLDS